MLWTCCESKHGIDSPTRINREVETRNWGSWMAGKDNKHPSTQIYMFLPRPISCYSKSAFDENVLLSSHFFSLNSFKFKFVFSSRLFLFPFMFFQPIDCDDGWEGIVLWVKDLYCILLKSTEKKELVAWLNKPEKHCILSTPQVMFE